MKSEIPPVIRQKVLIERTSKPLKAADALFKLAFLASVVAAVFCEDGWRALGVFGCLIFMLAIILTRWVRWWQHD